MRNLKRALSLTLASVMLLGMMVVGSSAAAGYDDVAETDNVEAIEVLQTIEVMVGDERGFGPERPVNRAEMAVVMGKLLSLDYNYYTALCPFTDVYDWAQGWVGACYANKIVSGRGDGIYDPGATVTAVEAASMLMRALGYFQYQNDYADGFELSTVTQGKKIGIFDNVGSSASEPMTRNQVAQMVLNALQSAVVEPDGNTINLTTPDGTVLTGKVNYVSVTSRKPYAQAISSVGASSIGSTNDGFIVELGERLYDGELKLYDKQVDVFNRPSRVWEYKGNEIGTYVKKELLKQTYTAKVTGADLYDLLTKNTIDTYRFEIAIDGVQYDEPNGKAVLNSNGNSFWFDKDDLYRTNKDGVGGTGKGVLTEVYVDTDYTDPSSYTVYISIINTYLARAAEDYDAKNDEVKLDVYAIDDSAVSKVYVKNNPSGTNEVIETIAVDGDEFDIKDVKDEDIFLVRVADSAIQEMVEPEIMSKTTINAFSKKDWINLSGTQYDYASTARYDVDVLYKYDNTNMKDMTYNVILDKYGYAIGLERNEDPDQYVFLTGIDSGYSNLGNRNVDANIIHLDGTMETVQVDTKDSKLNAYDEPSQANTWCEYRVSSSGVYTLTEVEFDAPGATNAGGTVLNNGDAGQFHTNVLPGDEEVTIDEKHISLPTSMDASRTDPDVRDRATSVAYGDDETVYINVELDQIRAKDGAGTEHYRRVIDDVTSVEVGHRNIKISVSNVVNTDKDGGTIEGTETVYTAPKEEIYTLYDKDNYIIAVVTIGEDEGVSSNWVYVHSATGMSGVNSESLTSSSTRDSDGDWIWTRDVILNGEKTKIREKGDHLRYLDDMNRGEWYEIKYDANGYVRKTVRLLSDMENSDLTDGFVSDIQDVRTAVTKKDNVLLRDEALVSGLKFDEKGTLYTQEDKTKGFAVSTEVKVVLALAGKKNSGNVGNDKVKEYNTVEDGTVYSGYRGLRAALNDMNYGYVTENPALIQLSAVLVNNSAVVIVIRDNNTAPDNRPTSGKPSDEGGTGGVTLATSDSGLMISAGDSLGSVEVLNSGKTYINIKFKAPAWAEGVNTGSGDVTFTAKLKVNGEEWDRLENVNAGTPTSGVWTVTQSSLGSFGTTISGAITRGTLDPATDKVTIEISNVKWKYAAVEYKYAGSDTAIAAANIKAGDGTSAAIAKLEVGSSDEDAVTTFGFKFIKAASQTVGADAKYSITGVKTHTDETTKTTGTIADGTVVKFDTAGIYAEGDEKVVVTISGVETAQEPEAETFTAKANTANTGKVQFLVVDSVPAAGELAGLTGWQNETTGKADKTLLVKSAEGGVKLASVTAMNTESGAAITFVDTAISGSGVFYYTPIAANVTVTAITTDKVSVDKAFVKADGSVANIKTDKAVTAAEGSADWWKLALEGVQKVYPSATMVNDADGNPLKIKIATDVYVERGTITMAHDLAVVTIDVSTKPVVGASASPTVADLLGLVGVTNGNANLYVKVGDSTAAASNATSTVSTGGTIDTNGGKGYVQLQSTDVTVNATSAPAALASAGTISGTLTIATADKFNNTHTYVKVGATGTIELASNSSSGKVADTHNVKAEISLTNATIGGAYKTAALVEGLKAGSDITDTKKVDLTFTFDGVTGDVSTNKVTVTLTEEAKS